MKKTSINSKILGGEKIWVNILEGESWRPDYNEERKCAIKIYGIKEFLVAENVSVNEVRTNTVF